MARDYKEYTIMDAKAATGIGNIIYVGDFRHIILSFNTASSANLTAKVQGSIAEDAPTFTSAQSATNSWDYVQIKDLEDGTSIDGDTGFAPAGTDDHRMFEVNTNGMRWITVNITARSAGSLTVKLRAYEN